jgi:hypothetical protein
MSYSYSKAYDIGLAKKPVNSLLLKESYVSPTSSITLTQVEQTSFAPQGSQGGPEYGTSNPAIWGPPYWYSLHNSAAHYPVQASQIVAKRMKERILAIPYEIPCPTCLPHASAYVEKFSDQDLDRIVSGRDNLIKFFVDFHNEVNRRYGKPIFSYESAYKKYGGK